MKITCGTDIIEIERIKKAIERLQDKFVNKILDVKIKENNDETRELIGILS